MIENGVNPEALAVRSCIFLSSSFSRIFFGFFFAMEETSLPWDINYWMSDGQG